MTGTHGLVIGKFYPPHLGHHHLVSSAARQVDRLTVLVMASAGESVPLADRVRWMAEVHRDEPVDVIGAPCDVPMDLGSDTVWSAHVAIMRAAVAAHTPARVDSVFSSESYGPELARRLEARHVFVDPARATHRVSGTAVRDDLHGHWDALHPVVRAGFATRIVVLGSESTGTTTVSRALAEHYRSPGGVWARTAWVPEYGRDHTMLKYDAACRAADRSGGPRPSLDDLRWDSDDFGTIARQQAELEEQAARQGSPVLICDTDALATRVWERRYVAPSSRAAADAVPTLRERAIYLLTDHEGVPFVQDGWRDGERVRAEMTGWFIEELVSSGASWTLLTGPVEERIGLAIGITDQLVACHARLDPPLRGFAELLPPCRRATGATGRAHVC